MNKQLVVGLIAGACAAVALGAAANFIRTSAGEKSATGAVAAGVPTGTELPAAVTATVNAPETPSVAAPQAARPARMPVPPVHAAYARVVAVQPVTKTVSEPREVCRDEPVVQQAPVKDQHRVAGTLIGAAIGGVLGHQIGGGDGKTLAKIAGAAAGGYAGNRIQDRMQKADTVTTTERRCETVNEPRERPLGYDVTYSYEGRTKTVRMNEDPGPRLPARDGRVIVDNGSPKS